MPDLHPSFCLLQYVARLAPSQLAVPGFRTEGEGEGASLPQNFEGVFFLILSGLLVAIFVGEEA